ncbi:Trypsin [Pedobacter xixiisoli]|uniref:Trypsin n=2 Tax=Pedobacter xixiisoli TaxID=1476464 RepID=A0A285ZP66_9SPHI|nr:trypsin-like serine protease [Pedobacter xixiisoli]SOD11453.1 Trypsin [Pedobacter xixiisoli]
MLFKHSIFFYITVLFSTHAFAQDQVSTETFPAISLVNRIDFIDPKYDQPRFSCGFLINYSGEEFAVTAKHLLKIIKTDKMKKLVFENYIKDWILYPLNKKEQLVTTSKLLNENQLESLNDASSYKEDWLLFSIKTNNSSVKPLEIRTTQLIGGEKLYVVGWTRKMDEGSQRVYEFEYVKSIGNRILLRNLVVPEQFGGLSGAPVIDKQGFVVGIVSGGTTDPETKEKYFSPCSIDGLAAFLKNQQRK